MLSHAVKEHLKEVLNAYGHLSAFQLEQITHGELPWKNARKGLAPDEASRNHISAEEMRNYFKNMLDDQE